jgi:hypothetical protein
MEQRIVMKFYDSAKAKNEDLDAVSQAQGSNPEYVIVNFSFLFCFCNSWFIPWRYLTTTSLPD